MLGLYEKASYQIHPKFTTSDPKAIIPDFPQSSDSPSLLACKTFSLTTGTRQRHRCLNLGHNHGPVRFKISSPVPKSAPKDPPHRTRSQASSFAALPARYRTSDRAQTTSDRGPLHRPVERGKPSIGAAIETGEKTPRRPARHRSVAAVSRAMNPRFFSAAGGGRWAVRGGGAVGDVQSTGRHTVDIRSTHARSVSAARPFASRADGFG